VKRALVTAGSSGLGAAIVQAMLEDGFEVWTQVRSGPGALPSQRARLHVVQVDLKDEAGRTTLLEALGPAPLDVLVHNLGVYPEAFIEDIDLERFRRVFELTCTVNFDLTQRLLPRLRAARGRVISIGDSGADRIEARAQATPYHIAKLGVHVLTRTWAQREGEVCFNMVSPGFLENSVGAPGEPIPKGRKGAFADIVGALRYLLSPEAAYVSGTNIVVSGGWNLG
jgi:NAD(P)-dependent dehydrogenase (short-subunit alcohol dehydrogenase family)